MQAEVGGAVDEPDEAHEGRIVGQLPDLLAGLGEGHVVAVGGRPQVAAGVEVAVDARLQGRHHLLIDHAPEDTEAVLVQAGQGRPEVVALEVVVVVGHGG